jgi:hypothetical protein
MNIEPANVPYILERFFDFGDGVVRFFAVEMSSTPYRCDVHIQAMDKQSPSGWSNVRFTLKGVSEFRFQVGKRTFEVLSGGIQIGWVDGLICVVLDAFPDDGPQLPPLAANAAYVIAEKCEFSATPWHPSC